MPFYPGSTGRYGVRAPARPSSSRRGEPIFPLAESAGFFSISRLPMTEPAITPELISKHGITPAEYERIKQILGREPNFTELGIFSVMWSEHCSYKNTRKELRKFPTEGPGVLVKAGEENAGV